MLYWSSVNLEDNLRGFRQDVTLLKNDIYSLRTDTNKIRDDVLKSILAEQKNVRCVPLNIPDANKNHEDHSISAAEQDSSKERPHIDPALPNLLTEDPFYEVTLPKLLGPTFVSHGVLHGATVGKPDNLHPITQWATVSTWQGMCNVSVAKLAFGKFETMTPDMAIKLEMRTQKDSDIPEFWVHLRDHVYWQPLKPEWFSEDIQLAPEFLRKHKVTAHDYKFYIDAILNRHVSNAASFRTYYEDLQEIEIIDDLTFIVRWKTETVKNAEGNEQKRVKYIAKQLTGQMIPLASFVYQYFADGKKIIEDDKDPNAYRNNSVWAQNFNEHWAKNIIISCGPWVFNGFNDRQIKFQRNAEYYFPQAVLVSEIIVEIKGSLDAVWQDFKGGHLDTYNLQPDQLMEFQQFLKSKSYKEQAKNGKAIERLDYLARSYTYVGWNQAKPFFQNKKIRQALTMAIDRQRIIRQNLNGMGIEITGTFFRNSPSYNTSIVPWPFDPTQAKRIMEEEGWFDSDGDGIIDKEINGKRVPFSFRLTYFVKNTLAKAICEYIATALKEIGIQCTLHGVDITDLSGIFEDKSFDAIFLAWMLGTPPEDPRQLWYSAGAKEKGSSNSIGFSNKEADEIIRELAFQYDPKKRLALYHRFGVILHEEAPYTFLYTPKVAYLYREYLQNVFIPADRQDLVPGANVAEPDSSIYWIKEPGVNN
jgi:peptide/nickel transport system substrate-binding protein